MIQSTLVVSPPPQWSNEMGLSTVDSLTEAQTAFAEGQITGLVLFISRLEPNQVTRFFQKIADSRRTCHVVIVAKAPDDLQLWPLLTLLTPFRIVNASQPEEIEKSLEDLIERQQLDIQEVQRQSLVQEQTNELRQLNRDLEARVERRQKFLSRAQAKLLSANQQIEVLHAATLAVHRARSLADLESSLSSVLKPVLGVSQVRIRYSAQSSLTQPQISAIHQPLVVADRTVGELLLIRQSEDVLTEPHQEMIQQVAEAVAMGVDRLAKLEQAEVLKQQWQATFDSITEPLCLTDKDFRILRTNRSYAAVTGKQFPDLINKNCFEIFFGKSAATEMTALGPSFKSRKTRGADQEARTYEVSSQPLHFEAIEGEVFLVMMRDVTSRLQLERQLLESSKMAELGLIGSSIAHELNNPLGGMLSFIQLVRMDLKGNEPYAEDVHEMERAAVRCRDIVQDLLGFARRSDSSDRRMVDLREVIQQALKISELQTRSQGIPVQISLPDEPLMIEAQPNQLSQALCNLLQNAAEAVLEKRRDDPRAQGEIKVELRAANNLYELLISDTGIGIAPEVQAKIFNPLFTTKTTNANSGLGLTMAFKIISEHAGRLEISSQPGVGTTAKVAFSSPDKSPVSQVFDSKI